MRHCSREEQWPAAAAAVAVPATQPATPTLSDVFSLKPALWGMSIDLPKAWKWLRERLHSLGRKQQAMPQLPKTASILNRLWRDPVWSKVIATGITALIGVRFSLVFSSWSSHPKCATASGSTRGACEHPVQWSRT